jgi:hypothetical protein
MIELIEYGQTDSGGTLLGFKYPSMLAVSIAFQLALTREWSLRRGWTGFGYLVSESFYSCLTLFLDSARVGFSTTILTLELSNESYPKANTTTTAGDAAEKTVGLGRRLQLFVGGSLKPVAEAFDQSAPENADQVRVAWQSEDEAQRQTCGPASGSVQPRTS